MTRSLRVLVALVLALGAAASYATGGNEARGATSPLPRTGFEIRNGSSWTTLTEELTYLKALEARFPTRVRRLVVGTSGQGRAVRLMIVGPGAAQTPAEIAAQHTPLVVCGQHGNEPAGREACLTRIRGHADSASNDTLLVMPTVNPDGRAANTRNNGQGLDINRDHCTGSACFRTPEARAVRDVMARYDPELVTDHHEYADAGARDVKLNQVGVYRHGSPEVRALSTAANQAARRSILASTTVGGTPFTVGDYVQEANSYELGLRDWAMSHDAAFVLFETPRLGRLSALSRVKAHRVGMTGALSVPR